MTLKKSSRVPNAPSFFFKAQKWYLIVVLKLFRAYVISCFLLIFILTLTFARGFELNLQMLIIPKSVSRINSVTGQRTQFRTRNMKSQKNVGVREGDLYENEFPFIPMLNISSEPKCGRKAQFTTSISRKCHFDFRHSYLRPILFRHPSPAKSKVCSGQEVRTYLKVHPHLSYKGLKLNFYFEIHLAGISIHTLIIQMCGWLYRGPMSVFVVQLHYY